MQGSAKIKVTTGGIYFYKKQKSGESGVIRCYVYVKVTSNMSIILYCLFNQSLDNVVISISSEDADINNY